MARTFQDSLEYDAQNAFLNANEFAQSIVHTPPDSDPETVVGNVDFDHYANQQVTDSPVSDERGTRVVERALLELPISVNVIPERPGGRYGSTFTIDGQVWVAKRCVGRDAGTQSWAIQRVDEVARKRLGS